MTRSLALNLQQQIELFGEQRVVVGEVVAEQREGFDVGAAAGDQLGAAAGGEVDGGEILKHPHRVERREHRHRAGQADALGRAGDRRHHHRRRGDRQIEAVVLADAEHVEPGLIGELGGRHDFGIALRGADGAAALPDRR